VTTPREQLIADWRNRLAAASETSARPDRRPAWLAQVRVRLYRLLLSLYGDGHWNAPAAAKRKPQGAAAIDRSVLLFAGKPAKGEAQIRRVLSSVAGAQDSVTKAGPLVTGIDRNAWAVVASTVEGIDPDLCARALKVRGIASRIIRRVNDVNVEVPGHHQWAARKLITLQRGGLIRCESVVGASANAYEMIAPESCEPDSWGETIAVLLIAVFVAFPLAWMLSSFEWLLQFTNGPRIGLAEFINLNESLLVWVSLCVLPLELFLLNRLRKKQLMQARANRFAGK
jgi:hypothetical protein